MGAGRAAVEAGAPAATPPVRIAYVLDTGEMGGVETHLLTLLRHLDRRMFRPHVFLPPPARGNRFAGALGDLAVPVTFQDMPAGLRDLAGLAGLSVALRRARASVAHVHLRWTWDNPCAILAARLGGSAVVVSSEHSTSTADVFPSRRARRFKRLLAALQDRIIVPCDHVGARLTEHAGVPAEKLTTIRHGIEIPGAAAERGDGALRRSLGVDPASPLIGMVARMEPRVKRFDDFIAAAREVAQALPSAHFVLVGDGPPAYRLTLHRLAADLGVGDRVHFLGFRGDAARIISELDVLVMASDNEACLPLVVLEAMARYTPAVVTSLGGAREQMIDGETGLLVPARDVVAIAGSVVRLVHDRSFAERISRRSRQAVEEHFTAPGMAERIQSLYLRLLAHRAASAGDMGRPVAAGSQHAH